MIHDHRFDATAERLRALIASGALPAQAAPRARDLLARLETPVRVALIGPEGRGRTEAVAALLGAPLLPEVPDRPAIEMVWADSPRTVMRRADGSGIEVDDLASALADPEAVLVTLARPLAPLRRTSLVDLVAESDPGDLAAALAWAGRRADAILWWSAEFGPTERAAWRGAPGHLRDHGFLVLWGTGADERADRLAAEGAAGFLGVLAAGTDRDGGTAGRADPGLLSLSAQLSRHVETGRQADNDSALLFLRKYEGSARPAHAQPADAGVPAPPSQGAWEQATPGAIHPESDGTPTARQSATPDPRNVPPADTTRRPAAPARAPLSVAESLTGPPPEKRVHRAFCREAAARIRVAAHQMMRLDLGATGRAAPPIARHCAETVQALAERLDSLPEADHPVFAEVSAMLTAADETLVLLEAEGRTRAPLDAVRLMQQLRRAFDVRAAS